LKEKTVHLVRHGATGARNARRFLGRTDVPLSRAGRRQAGALARYFERRPAGLVVTSPLRRARQTAEILVNGGPWRFRADPGWAEADFGRWEGLTFRQIARRDPKLVDRWAGLDPGFRFPGGESLSAFRRRLGAAWRRVLRRPEREVAVVTHGGVIRALLCRARRLPPERYPEVRVRVGSVTTLRVRGRSLRVVAQDKLP
jgi:alpha-ribazole phosphatase